MNRLPEALCADDLAAAVSSAMGVNLSMFRSNESSDLETPWQSYLAGYSMVINQADRHHQLLFDLSRALAKKLFHHVFAVVYLTPPGSQAVRLHTDDQDVILLQVWGQKHWAVYNAPTSLPYTEEMLGKEHAVPEELIGRRELDFIMRPGDVLYIPRGFLHEAATSSEPSLHITLTVPTSDFCWGVQMVKHLNGHLKSGSFSKFYPSALNDHSDEMLSARIQEALSTWASEITAEGVLQGLERRMERTNQGQEQQFAQMSAENLPVAITRGSRVRLMPQVKSYFERDAVVFSREGRVMRMGLPGSALQVVKALSSRPQWVKDLPCEDAFEGLCVLHVLLDAGVLQVFQRGPEDME